MLSFSVDRLSWLCFLWLIAAVITIDIQGNMVNTHGMRIRHRERLNDLPRLDPVTRQFNLPELDRARLLPAIPFSSTPAGVATHPTIHNPNPPPASTISDRTRWYQPPDEVNAADPTTEAELKIDYSRLKPAHPNVKHRFNVPPAVTIPKGVDYNTYLTYLSHFRHIPLNANPKDKRYVLDPPPPPIVVRPPPTPKPEPPPPEPEPEPEAAEPEPEPEPEPEEQPPPGEKPAPRPKRTPKKKAPAKRPAKKQQPKKKPPKRIIKNPIPPDSPRRQRQSVWVREVVERKAPGQVLWDSLPDVRPQTSTRYKRWWKLVDRGYGGGEAERALALENDDPDRAAVRLARDYSGYDGLHCLGKGNCFGDPRQAIFKTPRPTAVPEMPPSMQAPPPWENKKKSSTNGGNKKSRGVDYSSQLLKHQRRNRDPSNFKFSKKKGQTWSERRPPVLDPFKRVTPLPHEIEDHKFDNAPLRGSSLGTSEEKDAFTKLMRSWLLTIQSPFHTRKPDSTHESDANFPKMPSDTHAPIVPVKMQMRTDDQQGVQHLTVEWHQPPTYQAQTLAQLKASLERQSVLQRIRDERASVVITGRANNANHRPDPPAAPTPVAPSTPPTDGATPSDATPAPSEGLTPAQEQDAELEAGIGQQSQEQDQTQP